MCRHQQTQCGVCYCVSALPEPQIDVILLTLALFCLRFCTEYASEGRAAPTSATSSVIVIQLCRSSVPPETTIKQNVSQPVATPVAILTL